MSTQKGRATIFGITGTFAITGVATFSPIADGADFQTEVTKTDLRDTDNKLITRIYSGAIRNGSLTFTPAAASGTNTLANAKTSPEEPAFGTKVTLASFGHASIDGDWIYDGGWKLAYKKDGIATYSFDIMKSAEGVDMTLTPA